MLTTQPFLGSDHGGNRSIIGNKNFSAAGSSTRDLDWDDDKTLRIRGYAVDSILVTTDKTRKVGDINSNLGFISETNKRLLKEKLALERCDKLIAEILGPATSDHHEEHLWRSLCCDLTATGERAPSKYSEAFKFWRSVFRATNDQGQIQTFLLDQQILESRDFEYAMRKYTLGTSFCITKSGRLARVPHKSRPGDRICIFRGGRVPFVIRDAEKGYFQLVGECYVQGIMDGEAMGRDDLMDLEQYFLIQ